MSLSEIRYHVADSDKDVTQESMDKAIAEISEVIKKYPHECLRLSLDDIRDKALATLISNSTAGTKLFDLLKEEVIRNARNSCPPILVSEHEIDSFIRNRADPRYTNWSKGEPVRPPLQISEERWTGPVDTRLHKS